MRRPDPFLAIADGSLIGAYARSTSMSGISNTDKLAYRSPVRAIRSQNVALRAALRPRNDESSSPPGR